ncbi:MAG: NAD(P)/FAD-dependent oxidoreductase, partial [Pseudolabrys sp.]|nr:NAD(P)/FAD-dependent oxidoreductase [Pseudolabrys sp.]
DSLLASGARYGLSAGTDAAVASVLVRDDAARGVVLTSGEEISAKVVISNLNAKFLFQKLVSRDQLPTYFMAEIDSYRTFSTAFKIIAACDDPPRYRAFDANKAGFAYPT